MTLQIVSRDHRDVYHDLRIVLILLISTMVIGTLLNFGKRYEDNLRVIFDKWPKLSLGLDVRPEIQILKVI